MTLEAQPTTPGGIADLAWGPKAPFPDDQWNLVVEACWGAPSLQTQPAESFLSPPENLDQIVQDARYDSFLLGALHAPHIADETKVVIADILSGAIFDREAPFDPTRAGNFLREAVTLFTGAETPQPLQQFLYDRFTPSLLDRIARESNRFRWEMEPAEAALHAYCRFQTIDRLFGEEQGRQIHRELAQNLVTARILDEHLEQVGERVSTQEKRGPVIYLGSRGAELSQAVAHYALRQTTQELNGQAVIAPYYRDHILTVNLGDDRDDPDGSLMTIAEAVAELARVEGATRGAGRELPLNLKVDNNGQISVFPGTANVGGHIVPAAGHADGLRRRKMEELGIKFDGPRRADAYRNVQLENTGAAVLISLGDGALPGLIDSLAPQANMRTPTVNLIQDNGVAIGVEQREVHAVDALWTTGHGFGIPGIDIKEFDADGIFMAVRFATLRALQDAGPTIIQSRTRRLLPHSSQHGDHLTAEAIFHAKSILERERNHLKDTDTQRQLFDDFLTNRLIRPSKGDNQIALFQRLKDFLATISLSPEARLEMDNLLASIADPVSETLASWLQDGYLEDEEQTVWREAATQRVEGIIAEVMARPRPDPATALMYQRIETPLPPHIIHSTERLKLTGAEAIRLALRHAMEKNPHVLLFGTDIYKGKGVHAGQIHHDGGYFTQEQGLWEQFGDYPHRFANTAIAERVMVSWLLGMSTSATSQINHALRPFYDPQYADYFLEAWSAYHILGSVFNTTGGAIARPMGALLLSGAVPGGGVMHSHDPAGKVNQINESVDLLYATDPEWTYKMLLYCLLHENNPWILMVDKGTLLGSHNAMDFEVGTGLIEPGHARVLLPGEERKPRFLTYGPATNTVKSTIQTLGADGFGHLGIQSLRPFPHQEVRNFLGNGKGDIIVVNQEPNPQGVGAQIIASLTTDPYYRDVAPQPGHLHWLGGKGSAPLNDGRLLLDGGLIPTPDSITRYLREHGLV